MSTHALDALERIVDEDGDADDVLRSVVQRLVEEPEIAWAAIAFLEQGALALGPRAGTADESRRLRTPVAFQGRSVGELWVDGRADGAFLERVALLISAHVLIGWDTRGEHWDAS